MKQYRFEIVPRGNDRFYWLFAVVKRGERRVLARSARDYRSPKRVIRAIEALQGASIPDPPGGPFELPATSFGTVPGVVPLMVDEFPVEDGSEAADVFVGAKYPPRKRARVQAAVEQAAAAAEQAAAAAQRAAASAQQAAASAQQAAAQAPEEQAAEEQAAARRAEEQAVAQEAAEQAAEDAVAKPAATRAPKPSPQRGSRARRKN